MKHLLTLTALLISSLAMGQWPSLPYNPDDNADGLIGVADLQALLANYGSEFASAVVSEDGESAIVYMGNMGYPQCKYNCDHLPGVWSLSELEDLVPVWDEVAVGYEQTWLLKRESNLETSFPYFRGPGYSSGNSISFTTGLTNSQRCYCAAKQLPRVEYDVCRGFSGQSSAEAQMDAAKWQLSECVNEKLANGWQPLGTIQIDGVGSATGYVQALWRWAE